MWSLHTILNVLNVLMVNFMIYVVHYNFKDTYMGLASILSLSSYHHEAKDCSSLHFLNYTH